MDLISKQAVIDTATEYEKQLREILGDENELAETVKILKHRIIALQPTQPEHTCVGCKHHGMWENEVEYGYNSPCTRCRRRMNDNYEQ